MKSFALFSLDHNLDQTFTAADFWHLLVTLFCLPANLIIEMVSSATSISASVRWSIPPDSLLNSWSAACGSFVIWILLVAFVASTNK